MLIGLTLTITWLSLPPTPDRSVPLDVQPPTVALHLTVRCESKSANQQSCPGECGEDRGDLLLSAYTSVARREKHIQQAWDRLKHPACCNCPMGEARTEKVLQDLNDRASTVLQQYVQTSSADESVSVPLRGSDSAELVAGDSGRGKHKWLVYSSVGDSTDAWRSWLPGRDFDILINYHGRKGQAPEEMTEAVEMVQQRKGGKFASLQHFQNGGRLDQY